MRSEMYRMGNWIAAAALFAVLACTPAMAKGEFQAAVPVAPPVATADLESAADECLNFTPAEATDAEAVISPELPEADATAAPKPRPCKPCPDRPWCECKYNGLPRISCDPCCYIQPYTGQQICFD